MIRDRLEWWAYPLMAAGLFAYLSQPPVTPCEYAASVRGPWEKAEVLVEAAEACRSDEGSEWQAELFELSRFCEEGSVLQSKKCFQCHDSQGQRLDELEPSYHCLREFELQAEHCSQCHAAIDADSACSTPLSRLSIIFD